MPDGARTKRISRHNRGEPGSRGKSGYRRESVWSVNEGWRQLYFALFLLLMGAGSAFTLLREAYERAADKAVIESLADIFVGEAAASVASAGIALWITEVVMLSTMLARKLDERKARILREGRREGRQEGRREGRQEGRLAERAEWDAWLERMQAAQAAGEAFDEPPPSRRASDVNGTARSNGA